MCARPMGTGVPWGQSCTRAERRAGLGRKQARKEGGVKFRSVGITGKQTGPRAGDKRPGS
jgi:hypothetical protein